MSVLECGAAKREINPPKEIGDTYIAGYLATEAPKIKGIHDSIYTRVIVLSDGSKKIALISVDCIGLLADFIERLKTRLEAYGYERKQIFVFSTHTHSAPDTMGLWGPLIGISGINKRYMNFLIDSIDSALTEAESNLTPVEIFVAKSKIIDLIENYRKPNEINPNLKILQFQSNEGLIASLWTFSAQPELTTRDNVEISADYPGIVCKKIENDFGGIALFGLGLCGAQTPIYVEQGFDKMNSFAEALFKEVKHVFTKNEKLEVDHIEIRERKVKLRLENPDFQLMFQIGIFERELMDGHFTTTVTKIKLGNLHIIHIPGEPFPSLFSKIIDNIKPEEEYLFISLSGDALGYLIPKDQYKLKTKQFIDEENHEKFIGHELESIGLEASEIIRKSVRDIFRYKRVMAIGTHADDITIWAGGTLAMLSDEGNHLIVVRITDDYGDAVGISKEKAIKRNRKEAELAYKTIGAKEIIHMDYPTDTLAGVDYLELRGKLIELIRRFKPDLVVSFDLNGTDEENMDHIITARAVNEACWQSSVELFYPEHLKDGVTIHAVGERWLFARNPTIKNHYVDITDYVDVKIKSISQHKTVMKNWFYQHLLLARANNLYVELLEEDVPNPIRVHLLVKIVYGELGEECGAKYAEVFNKIDAGFLEDLADD